LAFSQQFILLFSLWTCGLLLKDIPVVGGFAVFGGGFVVGGLVTVGDGSSVVSEYSARKPRSGENEE